MMRLEFTRLAFALAAYRADHGSYPAKLADLSQSTSRPCRRTSSTTPNCTTGREGDGYLLYSVGTNGKDDGGKG